MKFVITPEQRTPRRTVWTLGAALWITVMVIMASFQTWRGAYEDGVLFYTLAAVLFIDRVTGEKLNAFVTKFRVPRGASITSAGVLFILLVVAPRHGALTFAIMMLIGIAMLLAAWPSPESPSTPSRPALRRSAWVWGLLVIAMCVWEALAFVMSVTLPGGSEEHPTVSVLLDPALNTPFGKIFFVGLWVAFGLGLLLLWRKKS